ncbi:YycH family regulatory protein [Jeotgalibacillus sp. S-D1]|uniref:YycH family regulatory protein n=1 Tax=Jeotgalibacillus sp. S-D1 TaxID=2552189 RepID=UPI0014055BA6|nr:two-component system activity regulator YycH [Jeotgalibacillus sp. S-D1]
MNIELFKSILLSLLVVLSCLLTWNVWSYQPSYTEIENTTPTVDVAIADAQDNSELIKPSRFLVHGEETVHGTTSENEVSKLLSIMEDWNFFNVRQNNSFNEQEFKRLVHGSNRLEILFPAQVPLSAYQDVFNFEVSQLPETTFDRIIVGFSEREEATFNVYFVSYDARIVHEAKVERDELAVLNQEIIANASGMYQSYFAYEAGEDRKIYLPKSVSDVIQYKYYMNRIDPQQFIDALFSDPNAVEVNSLGANEDQFFDKTSLMKVDRATNTLNYVNPSASDSLITGTPSDLLQKSRRFVNEHKGWTDPYRLYDLDIIDQQVTYRLHVQGLPVFNDNGAATIEQEWRDSRIYKYDRSFMSIALQLPTATRKASLPSGYDAIEALETLADFDPDLLEDMMIAYRMTKDSNTEELYTLEPMWFYLYNGSWQRVPWEGGEPVGLE